MPQTNKKKKEKYTWEQIKQVIKDTFKMSGSRDSWGVQVAYKEYLLDDMKKRLKKIKQYIK